MGCLADTDPTAAHCYANLRGELQGEGRRQDGKAIHASGDAECPAQVAWPRTESSQHHARAALCHHPKAMRRFQCADQDCAPRLANHIEAPVQPIGSIDIRGCRLAEHGGIGRCWTTEAVRGLIILSVGLRFHDDAAHAVDQKATATASRPKKLLSMTHC